MVPNQVVGHIELMLSKKNLHRSFIEGFDGCFAPHRFTEREIDREIFRG